MHSRIKVLHLAVGYCVPVIRLESLAHDTAWYVAFGYDLAAIAPPIAH
jgi:hypothetical protein